MIVPRTRLIILFAAIALPCALTGAVFPAWFEPAMGVIVLFALIAAIDAFLSRLVFNGVEVEFPRVVRLSRDKKGTVEFRIRNVRGKKMVVRVGLASPDELVFENEQFWAEVPAGHDYASYAWTCTGLARGCFRFERCYLETASPLRFWSFRRSPAISMDVRVYPNPAREKKALAALFLNRGLYGVHAHRQVGQGREFEKLREYVYGDSYDRISWKATARRRRPVTKVFQIEKTQEVYVIVDASRLSARCIEESTPKQTLPAGRRPETMLESFINTALIMGMVARHQGDLFGLLSFDHRVKSFIKAGSGKAHFNVCRDSLYQLAPQTVNPDYDDLFTFIGQRLRRRALLIFLTSLDDPVLVESFVKKTGLIDHKHLVLVNMLKPAGVHGLFSRPAIESLDDVYKDLGGHITLHNLQEVRKMLRLRGIHFSILPHEMFCTEIVSQYMSVKQRQLI